ncbi:MAG: DUF47 family protein [Acidobacteria bacterium]|nr:DUF47 family protein [Acidobacteriota bacterium]
MNFLPRDAHFFELFRRQGGLIEQAASLTCAAFARDEPDWDAVTQQVAALESDGDKTTHATLVRLNETFITPFDPEDIHELAVRLDDVLDAFDGLVQRCRIFGLGRPTEAMRKLTALLQGAAQACRQTLEALDENGEPEALARMRQAEVEADGVVRQALYELFRQQIDAVELLKRHDVYERLEALADRLAEVSHQLEEIRLKNA